jgi:hypothetical protein
MPKPGGCHSSGISWGDALRLPKRHPAWRRREAQPQENDQLSLAAVNLARQLALAGRGQ